MISLKYQTDHFIGLWNFLYEVRLHFHHKDPSLFVGPPFLICENEYHSYVKLIIDDQRISGHFKSHIHGSISRWKVISYNDLIFLWETIQ
jgi:hypothetical protein